MAKGNGVGGRGNGNESGGEGVALGLCLCLLDEPHIVNINNKNHGILQT